MDPGSLENPFQSCGIDTSSKRKLEVFKEDMSVTLV